MGTISNEEKAKNMTRGFLKEGLIKKSRLQELLIKAMGWKDKQFEETLNKLPESVKDLIKTLAL